MAIMVIVIANVVAIGNETNLISGQKDFNAPKIYEQLDLCFMTVYLIEFVLKVYLHPVGYWRNTFNLFDFGIMTLAVSQWIISLNFSNTDMVWFRIVAAMRVLRVFRLFSFVPSLQVVVSALLNTLRKNVLDIILLLLLIMFIFGVLGHYLFGLVDNVPSNHDWGSLGGAFMTLFIYGDGWVPYQERLEKDGFGGSEVFTAVFIFIGNFIVANLFIGVICQNIDDATQADRAEQSKKRKIAKMIKRELFLRKQRKDMSQLVAQTAKTNRNFQELLQEMVGALRHEDVIPMTHIACNLTWLETFAVTLTHQCFKENTMYRCQQLHFAIANTLAEYGMALKSYIGRTLRHIKDETVAAIKFDMGWKSDLPMFQFNSVEALQNFVVGSDADIGGYSEAYWGLTPEKTGVLWGKLSTEVPQGTKLKRSGYAGIKSKERPLTLFSRPRFDTSDFRYLAVRAKSDNRQWFVNLQTDGIYPTHLWQHRLHFEKPGEWETVLIPFRDFVLTSHGYVQPLQMEMDRSRIKTVGFSIVRQDGDFRMELDWIRAVNTEQTYGDMDIPNPEYLKKIKQAPFFVTGENKSEVAPTRRIPSSEGMDDFISIFSTLAIGLLIAAIAFIYLFRRTASLAVSPPPPPPPSTPLAESDFESKPKPKAQASARKVKQSSSAKLHAPRPQHPMFVCQLRGHTSEVTGISFSKEALVSTSTDRTFRFWSIQSFERKESNFIPKVTKFDHEGDSPSAVAVSADGTWVATTTVNTLGVRVYERYGDSFKLSAESTEVHKAGIIKLGMGLGYCFTCSSDTTLNFWRLRDAELIDSVKTNVLNNSVAAVSPSGQLVAVGGFLGDVRVWEVKKTHVDGSSRKGIPIAFSLSGHTRGVPALSFGGDDRVFTVSKDGTAKLWNIKVRWDVKEDPKQLQTLKLEEDIGIREQIHLVSASPDGFMAIFAVENNLHVWSIPEKKMISSILSAHPGVIKSIEWALDGKFFATIGENGKDIHVWSTQ
ncbi:Cation channel sperm-associated protein 3 [Phlyctochytrium planicorne]|nr:Cation channel sperm-associated protein 3 [Phlyctochytrium planicorne]